MEWRSPGGRESDRGRNDGFIIDFIFGLGEGRDEFSGWGGGERDTGGPVGQD